MKQVILVLSLVIGILKVNCQSSNEIYPSTIKSFESSTDRISFKCNIGLMVITFHATNIVHVNYFPSSETTTSSNSSLLPTTTIVNPKITESKTFVMIRSNDIEVRINKTNCEIDYLDSKGKIFLAGKNFSLHTIPGKIDYNVNVSFAAPIDENYFGLGQIQGENSNHRGLRINLGRDTLSKNDIKDGFPFMVTNKNYGFVLENYSNIIVSPGIENKTEWLAEAGNEISYFVIYSSTLNGIYAGYNILTGAAPIPSKSSFGYTQGRQQFKNQNEVLKIARKYRENKYPCDNILIDRQPWKVNGDMEWEPKSWPNPTIMNRDLADNNFNSFISCPINFVKESKNFGIADKNRYFILKDYDDVLYHNSKNKSGSLIDFTNANAAKWYWNLVSENYFKRGFSGCWMNESNVAEIQINHSWLIAREIFEDHQKPATTRCLFFSDNVSLGFQRYGTIFSKSDDNPNWDDYKKQILMGINLCASGFPFWSTNVGGYKAIKENKQRDMSIKKILLNCDTCMVSTKKMKDYVELYVRWFQFGVFCPLFLSHGIREQNEIWSYGGNAEKILAKYLKTRYRLLPYIYSLAYQSHKNGSPMMRGLFMDFSFDPKIAEITDEYMFGPSFLIAPVMEQGMESREVYLPADNDWYDYWTYKKIKGGENQHMNAPIEKIPILIKAGSIIPFGPEIEYSTEKSTEPLEIRIFPGTDAVFELYEDENNNSNYENGKYSIIPFAWNNKKQILTIGERKGEFEGMILKRSFTILFGADYTKAPETIIYSGKAVTIKIK